jgi:hypothetical protein
MLEGNITEIEKLLSDAYRVGQITKKELKNYTNNIYFLDEKFLQELKTATDRRK